MKDVLEQQIAALPLPEPSKHLRDSVRERISHIRVPPPTRADRIWYSRRWRLTAGVVLLALSFLHLVEPQLLKKTLSREMPGLADSGVSGTDDLLRELHLSTNGLTPELALWFSRRAETRHDQTKGLGIPMLDEEAL